MITKTDKELTLPWKYIIDNIKNIILVDVRNQEDYIQVENSISIPNPHENIEKIRSFKKPVVLTCYKGICSLENAKFLRTNDIDAYSAKYGYDGYLEYKQNESSK